MIRAVVLLSAIMPGVAHAQAYNCSVPASPQSVRADRPTTREPVRDIPIGGYTLALTWGPQYCRDNGRRPGSQFQCGPDNRFGFTLHGLWPDGVGRQWPQYCRSTGLVPQPVIKTHLCTTPSAQLMQHEWAKHGTCMPGYRPARYFQHAGSLFGRLRYPDMDALSRKPLTAGRFAEEMARTNPGLRADQIRVTTTRRGWLDEVWICLDTRFRYERCRPGSGGVARNAALKIWRGRR